MTMSVQIDRINLVTSNYQCTQRTLKSFFFLNFICTINATPVTEKVYKTSNMGSVSAVKVLKL